MNRFVSRRTFSGAAGASALLLSACGGAKPKAEAPLLRVAVNRQPTMAGLYLAYENGYFEQEGARIELIESRGAAPESLPLLSAGKLDVVFSSMAPAVINACARGARVRIAAGRDELAPDCSDFGLIYGHPKSFPGGLKDVRQLKGKRVAVSRPAGITQFSLSVLMDQAGMKPGEVNEVYLASPEAVAALRAHQIDAFVAQNLFGPRLSEISPDLLVFDAFAKLRPGFQYTFLYFGAKLLETPDSGAAFLAGYLRGCREYVAGKTPRFLTEMAKSNGLDPAKAGQGCRQGVNANGTVDGESIRFYMEWAVRHEHCEKAVPLEQMVDTRPLESAQRKLAGRV